MPAEMKATISVYSMALLELQTMRTWESTYEVLERTYNELNYSGQIWTLKVNAIYVSNKMLIESDMMMTAAASAGSRGGTPATSLSYGTVFMSSVNGTVARREMDHRRIRVRFPAQTRYCSFLHTFCTHLVSSPMDTRGFYHDGRDDKFASHLHPVFRLRRLGYTSSLPTASWSGA
jgi:hypothetical protein